MSGKGPVLALPSYDTLASTEHGPTLQWVLAVCQHQQERIALLEETVAQ
ncbi:MAG: hypothetical protein HOP18_05195 [Deltaproteobacteria bacterium]|nr:hypothetical protein [Deltaproteobacteria bacterium]